MTTHKMLITVLSILIGSLFMVAQVQASEDINGMSKCMVICKGDKDCVSGCVYMYAPNETANDTVKCLEGCGLGISTQSDDATLMENIKACCQGCLGVKP